MKILKKNTFTDLYVQQTIGISGEIQIFKLELKPEYAENKPLRSYFISSAKALKTYSGKQFLTFIQLIDNEQEAAMLFQTKTAKSLTEYLAENENLSDKELSTLFEQLAQCLGGFHQGMMFYPAIQPNAFYVDSHGQVQLSFFDLLEFRMYQFQQITPDSSHGFMNYTSPERRGSFFSISLEADIYSLGLIYWHIFLFAKSPVKNWKLITENTYFSSTETIWDRFFEMCFQEEGAKRYKNINALVNGLPRFENEAITEKSQTQKTPPSPTNKKEEQIDFASQHHTSKKQHKRYFFEVEKLKALWSKNKTIVVLFSIFVLLGIFKLCSTKETINVPTRPEATSNAWGVDTIKGKIELINPEGYSVKIGKETILTEDGLNINSFYHRFYQGKWETKPIYPDGTEGKWKNTIQKNLVNILNTCFVKNTEEPKIAGGGTPPPPPPSTHCTKAQKLLDAIQTEAENAYGAQNITVARKNTMIKNLQGRLDQVKKTYKSCGSLNFNLAQSAINNLK